MDDENSQAMDVDTAGADVTAELSFVSETNREVLVEEHEGEEVQPVSPVGVVSITEDRRDEISRQ